MPSPRDVACSQQHLVEPRGLRDLVHVKKAGQAANLMGRGISDLQEVKERVNAPRPSRRGASKPPSDTSRPGRRRKRHRR
jgi:hypothetical protein